MGRERDDFEWLVRLLAPKRKQQKSQSNRLILRRFDEAEARLEKRSRYSSILILLLEMLPFIIMMLLLVFH